jgi:hypothetical protein
MAIIGGTATTRKYIHSGNKHNHNHSNTSCNNRGDYNDDEDELAI